MTEPAIAFEPVVAAEHAGCNHERMAGITIRDLDEVTFAWLRERARARGASLNAELLEILAAARGDEIARRRVGPAAASARLARKLGVRTSSSSAALRRDRDARR